MDMEKQVIRTRFCPEKPVVNSMMSYLRSLYEISWHTQTWRMNESSQLTNKHLYILYCVLWNKDSRLALPAPSSMGKKAGCHRAIFNFPWQMANTQGTLIKGVEMRQKMNLNIYVSQRKHYGLSTTDVWIKLCLPISNEKGRMKVSASNRRFKQHIDGFLIFFTAMDKLLSFP